MATGYEVHMYADITSIAKSLQSIAESLKTFASAVERVKPLLPPEIFPPE